MSAITLTHVSKAYGAHTVIPDISLSIAEGEFVVLVGPSGCGKSTLLRMMAGLEEITGGELRIGDRLANDVAPADRNVAMVFQDYALYPHMSVADNLGFGLKMRNAAPGDITARIADAARVLKLDSYLDRRPSQLSGGQRQRVAMGRAIVRRPEAFLFDEPLSNLDAALRIEMRLEIAKLHRRMKATTVYVTHDQVEAMTLADRIVCMNAGRVEQVGPPLDLYRKPASLFVARFIGSPTMNAVPARARSVDGQCSLAFEDRMVPVEGLLLPPGDDIAVTVGLRPEDISVCAPQEAWFEAPLAVIERLGSQTFGYFDLPGERMLTVELPRDSKVQPGERLAMGVRHGAAHLFRASDGQRIG